ncbi:hypothetical protein Salat_0461700 [Sesamum alatum]|uniref:Wall-associated receptor kinase galacturonan-binding domain-containing protein n=1 Tax=Sesamum alatum TaxID=300844 RepID=A0AAE1Z4G7_9LAMI|nr:hypothetical protein Salat_0461700 [Sesamum alatum]
MQGCKKLHDLLQLLFLLNMFFPRSSVSEKTPVSYCGGIRVKSPFLHQHPSNSSLLSHMIICKSDKLYYRTSIGLFKISHIDYENKLLTVSHSTCSSASSYVSPHHLSAGFVLSSSPNSLVLFNCSNPSSRFSIVPCNYVTQLSGCNDHNQELAKGLSSCLLVDDVGKLDRSFHPGQLNCTHYSLVYRNKEVLELGTRISFDIPDHVPNPCNECEKPDGNCGVGLKCVCHPQKCKDKVVSAGAGLRPCGNVVFYLVLIVVVLGVFR